ncbi:1-deoxy-D-xylulose 5-phosphate reductoisomerase [Spiroplasma corruscae]|uniref:1-deoxy-D-xylulose 5-phosphate reductoisomerase n=1 Tax=Spiroplasma corruscae TaxID=216934 RepID=A0A222ENG9_9MOLU|nr:1-deoxy-D-xylulose-5-phosphate reductoisomerase [Spiroplasma corruscae]ASP28038.1 1-deoxy-D-xylulose 5-phosphate reductoisomerase [Spiroplasma corruscae]
MKRIVLFGASGSIGQQSLDILKGLKDDFELIAISVGKRNETISSVVQEFPTIKKVYSFDIPWKLKREYKSIEFVDNNIESLLDLKPDIVINAISGIKGLNITINSIKKGITLLNANKESIVVAGNLINNLLQENKKAKLYPLDSEHCAIFQCIEEENKIKKLVLTASGGPFRDYTLDETKKVTLKDALNHPNWSMGKKITIDSATMFNKALEIIEAYHLFKTKRIDVIVHKESVVHSMVMFEDNSIKAQLSYPDMRQVINYFLNYPSRKTYDGQKDLDWEKGFNLSFKRISASRFIPIELAMKCISSKNSKSIALNAANEVCVDMFLNGLISFYNITLFVKKVFDEVEDIELDKIEDIYEFDKRVRNKTKEMIEV